MSRKYSALLTIFLMLVAFTAADASTFQASGPTNETYSQSGSPITVTFANTNIQMRFTMPFYALMIPGTIADGNEVQYINGWAEGYDSPNQNANWDVEGQSYEPTSDNDPGYNHVAYWVESETPARIVIRHRYALIRSGTICDNTWNNPISSSANSAVDTGEWIDQWYIFSPDGTHIKKTRVYTQDTETTKPWVAASGDERCHEVEGMYFQNFGGSGQSVNETLETNYWTLIKYDGSSRECAQDYATTPFSEDWGAFQGAPIQLLNTEAVSGLDPFRIGRDATCFNSAYRTNATPGQTLPIPHFGSPANYYAMAVGDLYMSSHWQNKTDEFVTEIWLNGYTSAGDDGGNDGGTDAAAELSKLAKSWYYAPAISISSGASTATNDLGQRAYLIKRTGSGAIQGSISASSGSPLVNPTFIIKDWGNGPCSVTIGSQVLTEGTNFYVGYYPTFTFEDDTMTEQTWNDVMIVWAEADETSSATVIIAPSANAPVIQQGTSVDVGIDEDETPTAWSQPTITATNPVGGDLTWSLASAPPNGSATVNGTGASPSTLDYTPDSNFTGIDSFVVQVANTAAVDTITINVVVTNSPDAPTAVDDDSTTPMNSAKDIYVLLNDIEPDHEDLSITAVGSPLYGDAIHNGTYITYTPSNGIDSVTDIFSYTIDDGTGRTDDGTVSIEIGGGATGNFWITNKVVFGGVTNERTSKVHVPATYDGSPMPLLFMFANSDTTPDQVASQTDWNTTADNNGFMVIYPEARDNTVVVGTTNTVFQKCWELPDEAIGLDNEDVHFVSDLIDWAQGNYNVPTSHVFSSGFSYGGIFSYFVASMNYPKITGFSSQSSSFSDGGSYFWPANIPTTPGLSGFILHSPTDPYVPPSNGDTIYNALTNKGHAAHLEDFSGGSDPGHAWSTAYNQAQYDFFMTNSPALDMPPNAVASATPQLGSIPLLVNFTGSASSDDNSITAYAWNFGDGNTSNIANPSHTYTSTGTFYAVLTVTDNIGQTDNDSVTIAPGADNLPPTISSAASADASTISPYASTTVRFLASDGNGDTLSYLWSRISGSGNVTFSSTNSTNSYVTFDTIGSHTLRAVADDGNGASATSDVSITVAAPSSSDYTTYLEDDGLLRKFIVHVPPGYDGNRDVPLLYVYHGLTMQASDMTGSYYGWKDMADANNFVVIFPDSWTNLVEIDIGSSGNQYKYWRTDANPVGNYDLTFFDALLNWATKNYRIIDSQKFSTGYSNGAYWSYYLLRWRPNDIAAIGMHSGAESAAMPSSPKVKAILLNAPDDNVVPFSSGTNSYDNLIAAGHNAQFVTLPSGRQHGYWKEYDQTQWDFFMDGLFTTNGVVPVAWLEDQNAAWTNDLEAAATNDPDGDGFSTEEEYWSGTDPQSSNSFLKIDSVVFDGANVVLEWKHSHLDGAIPPLAIQRRTDLSTGTWSYIDQHFPTNGTNTWSGSTLNKIFYRIVATNTP